MNITIAHRHALTPACLEQMHKLRARVFKYKKNWDVSVIAEMEIDGYDALDPIYMIARKQAEQTKVSGCWRILPTTGPYMLKDSFPQLLNGQKPPLSPHIWELSRFALEQEETSSLRLSKHSTSIISQVIHYAKERGVTDFVTVTTVGVERLLSKQGLDLKRFGPASKIGIETAVALRIALNDRTLMSVPQPATAR